MRDAWPRRISGLTDLRVGITRPSSVVREGPFPSHVDLPDFTRNANESAAGPRFSGSFNLILRERRTGNIIAFPRPEEPPSAGSFSLQSSYPLTVWFEAEP